jgi:O-antigen/teichoic acid export membrane protein
VSRTGRIARALTVGYGYQAVVAVTGLVLTPFLLSRLGVEDYGQWLAVGQVLGLLGLLDLGVTAILPREVARSSGAAGDGGVAEVARRAWWLVWLQTPVVAVVAAAGWVGVSAIHPELGGPLAVILAVFVAQFPLRVPAAVLTGLQDLTFCAVAQAASWATATALSVGLVFAGWGLYAMAAGWAVGQLLGSVAAVWRVWVKFPGARAGGWPGWAGLWDQFRPSLWMSLAQLARVLVAGTDLLVVAWVLGPVATVAYSCTTKLVAVVTTHCYSIGLASQPALAQLRAAGDRGRLENALRAVGMATLVLSGAVAIGMVAVNRAFVTAWVGADQYAGPTVTLLAVAAMLARHLAFSWWNAAYVLGYERRLCGVLVADGLVTVALMAGGAALVGLPGVLLGSLAGAVLVYLPTGLFAVAGALGVPAARVLGWVGSWAAAFAVVFGPVAVVAFTPAAESVWAAGGLVVAALTTYAGLAYGLASRDPLRVYRDRAASAVRRKLGWLPRPVGADGN